MPSVAHRCFCHMHNNAQHICNMLCIKYCISAWDFKRGCSKPQYVQPNLYSFNTCTQNTRAPYTRRYSSTYLGHRIVAVNGAGSIFRSYVGCRCCCTQPGHSKQKSVFTVTFSAFWFPVRFSHPVNICLALHILLVQRSVLPLSPEHTCLNVVISRNLLKKNL